MNPGLPKFGRPSFGRPSYNRPRFDATWSRARVRSLAWLPAGLALASLIAVVALASGMVVSSDSTLVIMGFDPDRSRLITALIIGAVAAGVVVVALNRIAYSTLLGAYAAAALFAPTFIAETQTALAARGSAGTFSAAGWILTLVALGTLAFVAAWIGATLGKSVRPALVDAAVAVRQMVSDRRATRKLSRKPLAVLSVMLFLAVAAPPFGDMVNLSPDALMLNGARGPVAVTSPSPSGGQVAVATATPSPTPSPEASESSAVSEAPSPTPTPKVTAKPGSKPWLAWKPKGVGTMTRVDMQAPWTGGQQSTSEIDIYTPPGYDPSGDRLYPVLYEAPTGLALWEKGTGTIGALDTMITAGDLPAVIVVFIDSLGAPFGDTQCADMWDGSQWFERYISSDVVSYVDARYKTIADPRARGIMGMSAGGFCAPMLATRHPDVFHTSISFSGYFWAGASGVTAAQPFGSSAPDVLAHSPMSVVTQVKPEDRSSLYFIVVANLAQDFYGPNAANFDKTLSDNGFGHILINSGYKHGWPQVRYEIQGVLKDWATQLVATGIW